jgi:DNA-directed RNA polymerase subunit M/transcription elongation factor TFIIS
MARCTHSRGNIQQFTEICLDCGRNVYETDEQYLQILREQVEQKRRQNRQDAVSRQIEALEREFAGTPCANSTSNANACPNCGNDHLGMC